VGTTVRIRLSALVAVLVLVLAACGSRADDGAVADDEERDDVTIVSEEAPCSDGDATGATDVGITDDTITIGTIQDISGLRPDLMIAPRQAMEAFIASCNSLGGINGRDLVLQDYDSSLLEHSRAAEEACEGGNFAMVGSASALDNAGAQELVDCGLINVPTFTATPAAADADLMVQAIPNPTQEYSVGPCLYLAQEFPEAVEAAAMTSTDFPVTEVIAERFKEACTTAAGFEFVSEQTTVPQAETGWAAKVKNLDDAGARYYTHWGEKEDSAQMLINLNDQGVELDVIEFGPQMYDAELPNLAAGTADGALIWITVVPLEEVDDNPEMQTYFDWLERTSGGSPTALGIQTWSSALLFATAAAALGSDLTRDALLDELGGITEWDGHGLHHTANPGENRAAHCFIYVQVVGDGFERSYPDEGFDCDESYRQRLDGDYSAYGEGARVSG
jgi:ABC-type branched-subunit amino acid transport system substrate-binding protein